LVSLDRVDLEFAGQMCIPVRTLTRLDADYYAALDRERTDGVPAQRVARPSGRPATPPAPRPGRSGDSAWLRLLERAVGGWAPTLRGSLILVTVFLVAAVLMAVTMGVDGMALAGVLAVLAGWLNATGNLPRA
jgi:hypothetical protein